MEIVIYGLLGISVVSSGYLLFKTKSQDKKIKKILDNIDWEKAEIKIDKDVVALLLSKNVEFISKLVADDKIFDEFREEFIKADLNEIVKFFIDARKKELSDKIYHTFLTDEKFKDDLIEKLKTVFENKEALAVYKFEDNPKVKEMLENIFEETLEKHKDEISSYFAKELTSEGRLDEIVRKLSK